ncbi:MAG: DUF4007 family protein [Verrucomicrobia bacterium]|nr:DUF4007 family protein [Verrucomicrobiota bacterium]
MTAEKNYRISGHESFPCRYTWLPKAVRGVGENPRLFSNEEQAMVDLGVGRNMTRAIRFWAQAAGVVTPLPKNGGHSLTEFARVLFGQDSPLPDFVHRKAVANVGRANLQVCSTVQFNEENGLDPFLEDIRTLWLIHWNLSTDSANPLLAWDFLLNRWQEPELVPSKALKTLEHEAAMHEDRLSPVTVQQHFETFLHTYVPTRSRKGEVQEDNLDCPLVELELIVKVGERELDSAAGKREPIYAFRREEKPEITAELFVYCVNDFWQKRHGHEETLGFREIAHGHGSPGQIFKIPEEDVRTRVEALARQTDGFLIYQESAHAPHVRRHGARDQIALLREIYAVEVAHV